MAKDRIRKCTPWMREVALRIFRLTDNSDEAVSQFLTKKKRSETAVDVRAWFAELSPDRADALLDAGGEWSVARQLVEARKFVEELHLVGWVKEQNSAKGIAPSATAVLDQVGPHLARCRYERNRYRWLKRCMARWSGRRVHLGGGDGLSADEFGRKVERPGSRGHLRS
jgi:hypothetical protein